MDYSQLFSLSGRKIIITGGLGILGKEFVKGIVAAGGHALIVERRTPATEAEFEALGKELAPDRLSVYYGDLSELEKLKELFGRIASEHGDIHGLINNAAIKTENFFEPFLSFPVQDWEKVMRVNCDAAFFMAQAVAKHQVERGIPGSIVNILSIYGLVGPHESIYEGSEYLGRAINTPPVYSASKSALHGITKYMAVSLGKNRVRVNALTPGGVASGQNSVFSRKYSEQTPMGRQALPHEMVGAAIYLLSNASSYVTGHNLVVDGGWTAW